MSTKTNGGPAFPRMDSSYLDDRGRRLPQRGMTLRDYFAGIALSSISMGWSAEDAAKSAYTRADAMLKAREEHDESN